MELRDYIYQYNNPPVQKKKRIRQPVFGTALDLCDVISENKKQLIRDAFYEIGKRHFQDAVERWNQERPEPGYNSAFYQTVAEDGRRGVSQIKICNLVGTYDFPERIPAEEFYEDYNQCIRIGNQKYVTLRGESYIQGYERKQKLFVIYYFADGAIYVSGEHSIAELSEAGLGRILAEECVTTLR